MNIITHITQHIEKRERKSLRVEIVIELLHIAFHPSIALFLTYNFLYLQFIRKIIFLQYRAMYHQYMNDAINQSIERCQTQVYCTNSTRSKKKIYVKKRILVPAYFTYNRDKWSWKNQGQRQSIIYNYR